MIRRSTPRSRYWASVRFLKKAVIATPRKSSAIKFLPRRGVAASLRLNASTSSGVGGMCGRRRLVSPTLANGSTTFVMLSTLSTPGTFASASVTRAIFSIVEGANTSSARTPITPTSSLPKSARVVL